MLTALILSHSVLRRNNKPMNDELNPIHLPFHDAFALRRAFARMDNTATYMSPALRLLLDYFGDLSGAEAYSRFNAYLSANQHLIQQIMPIDPNQDYLDETIRFIQA